MDWQNRLKKIREQPTGAQGFIPKSLIGELPKLPEPTLSDNRRADSYPTEDWRPIPRAWLAGDKLLTEGVFPGEWPDGGVAIEILKLTEGNLTLQRKLLQETVGSYYPGHNWLTTVRRWTARAAELFERQGLGLHEARWQAAEELHLLAWAEEWSLTKPPA